MADPLTLACCLGKIGEIVLGGIGDCLVGPIKRQFTYMCCFHSNIMELETQLTELETTRQGVQMGVDENRRKVRVIEAWLTSANEVTTEIEGIIQDKAKVKEGCLNGWCPNLKLCYSLSRKAVKKTKVVVDLKADGVQYTQSSYSPPPACLVTLTNRDFMGFESRRLIMEEIIKALKHDEINLIGVCGMGGVGKTTLVNEAANRAKEDNHFDEVAMAVVSQEPNLTNVQACIAEMLGLKNLRDTESPIGRADLLRRRLLQDNKKVFIILDDIWAEFDLKAMGIPLESADKNFKVLYTSRTRDLWHDLRTKKEIPLEILSKDEAWQLFREKAGDSADAPDLQPIAKQIVDERGCLPLALVLIGSALSKKSGRNYIKEIWKGMLDRLTCAGSTPADKDLSSRLALSYEYLDEQAKRLFLLCCLFSEDEDIRIDDLARYGLGLSLFDGIPEMEKIRPQVFLIVDDLKSRYLLLDGKNKEEECVKVHDVVRDMGISIASKNKFALVIHGDVSEWPKKDTYEHYTSISLISGIITELPKGLTCPNLEFLLLDCRKLKELPCNFFEGMGKLKVLVLNNFKGILSLASSLKNLHTLSLSNFCGKLDNVYEFGRLFNLKTLSFRDSQMEELPEEIGELVDLTLLDLTDTKVERIPQGVISRLVHLEELYILRDDEELMDWEGEGKEEEGRYANLRELELLSNLNTLEIGIKCDVVIPKVPIFRKLKIYKVLIAEENDSNDDISDKEMDKEVNFLFGKCKRLLAVISSIPIPLNRGGIDSLLRSSDFLFLEGKGCNDLVQALLFRDGVDGLQQLKLLGIRRCDTPECLADTMHPVHLPIAHVPAIFPILKVLDLLGLVNLREICGSTVPTGSFGELTFIRVQNCGRLRNLFQLPIEGCLPQLKRLIISSCGMMEELIWKEQREDVHAVANRIEFPKLEVLRLEKLPSLMRFCRGIDQIDFPQLKELCLNDIPQVNLLFHNNGNLSSHSKRNDNFGFLSLFPEKVSLPNLEVLRVDKLENLERLEYRPLSVGSFSKLNKIFLRDCGKLLCVIPSQFLPMLRELQELTVESCNSLEVVFELEGLESNEPNPEILSPLQFVKLRELPKLNCISNRYPMGIKYIQTLEIHKCNSLRYVFAPTMTKSIPQLRKLQISSCEMLSRIVAEENGSRESSADEVEFPQLERLELLDLPNLLSFFPNVNVNVNTTTLAKSTDHYHNPLQPQPLFNEKVAIPSLEYLGLSGLQNVSDLWSSELPTSSFSKLKTLNVGGFANLRSTFHPSMVGGLANLSELVITDCLKMEGVVYWEEEIEDGQGRKVEKTLFPLLRKLQLSNLPNLASFFPNVNVNTTTLAKSHDHLYNPMQPQPLFNEKVAFPCLRYLGLSGLQIVSDLWGSELSTSSFSKLKNLQVTDPASLRNKVCIVWIDDLNNTTQGLPRVARLLYTNSGDGVVALGSNGTMTMWNWPSGKVIRMFMPPPPASTFLAFYPQDKDIIAIGMEDSTIRIYNQWTHEVKSELKGQEKRITGLAFSTILNILVSSAADAQLCIWRIDTWEHLKSVPIQLPAGKACNGNTRVQFHSDQIRLLVSHETQLAIYDASEMDRIRQWVPQDVLPTRISFAVYSCDSQLVYTSFCEGNIGVFDADSLTLACRIVPSIYLYPNRRKEEEEKEDVNLDEDEDMDENEEDQEEATASVFPLQWQPASGLAMTNDVTGVNLEEAVPCMALSEYDSSIISACGGAISLFEEGVENPWELEKTFMPPPPASTFLAFHPQDDEIIAIGREDSTIRIYNHREDEVESELKGHEKRITGLAFSVNLNILVSSGANAQWVPQDVLPAPISFAAYSCDSQLVYTSFCDGNIGVFDADSLTLTHRIAPSAYSPTLSSG
ncbi:hypothetical protein RHMOL_Rhmol03G0039000 [Rhododendron molle]|uniref:Uncharacterized protein n=1 Tax=Rhododendron molle TaxID=49168 RepID=A0ACC0PCM2_RHOML|nr:hypothetical protein RHMOL_Rhmol03G0039000 [Rhododendron molle]